MTFGSLFSGIGGIDVGLERAGHKCLWQGEKDEYCRRVLEKHWPNVKRWDDVRTFPPGLDSVPMLRKLPLHHSSDACSRLQVPSYRGVDDRSLHDWRVDIIAGGFPCQDISKQGNTHSIDGARSGLWSEFYRIACLLRPKYLLVENVGAITVRGLLRVLGDIAQIGLDAEWSTISASSFGACHQRERLFIVAYPPGLGLEGRLTQCRREIQVAALDRPADWPHLSEPLGLRSLDGVPNAVDRIRGLGNAVVPQVAEWIGGRLA